MVLCLWRSSHLREFQLGKAGRSCWDVSSFLARGIHSFDGWYCSKFSFGQVRLRTVSLLRSEPEDGHDVVGTHVRLYETLRLNHGWGWSKRDDCRTRRHDDCVAKTPSYGRTSLVYVCGGSFAHGLSLWRVLRGWYADIRLQRNVPWNAVSEPCATRRHERSCRASLLSCTHLLVEYSRSRDSSTSCSFEASCSLQRRREPDKLDWRRAVSDCRRTIQNSTKTEHPVLRQVMFSSTDPVNVIVGTAAEEVRPLQIVIRPSLETWLSLICKACWRFTPFPTPRSTCEVNSGNSLCSRWRTVHVSCRNCRRQMWVWRSLSGRCWTAFWIGRCGSVPRQWSFRRWKKSGYSYSAFLLKRSL